MVNSRTDGRLESCLRPGNLSSLSVPAFFEAELLDFLDDFCLPLLVVRVGAGLLEDDLADGSRSRCGGLEPLSQSEHGVDMER